MYEVLLTLIYTILFTILVFRLNFFKLPGIGKWWLTAVFWLKILAGIALYFIYSHYYTDRATADIFRYFDDSKIMFSALFERPSDYFRMLTGIGNDTPHFDQYYHQMNNWFRVYESNLYNDSHTIIRFNAFIRLFSFGYYNVHTVFMCFVSLAGLTALYRFFAGLLNNKTSWLFAAVFLIPSVLFWGSGVLKEGLLLFGMGFFLYSVLNLLHKRKPLLNMLLLAVALTVLLYTKFYIFIILIPLTLAFIWNFLRPGMTLLKYLAVMFFFLMAGMNIHYFFPEFDFMTILIQKQHDFISLARETGSGSMVDMEPLQPGVFNIALRLPEAFALSFFRPLITECKNLLMLMPAVENALLLIWMIASVFFFKKPLRLNFFYLTLFFFIMTYTLTGLTTPVMGAIVRYKVPAMPFLIAVLIQITDFERLRRRISSGSKTAD
jgi:hypothetical protein